MTWSEILKGIDKNQLRQAYEGYLDVSKDDLEFKDKEFEDAIDMYLEG